MFQSRLFWLVASDYQSFDTASRSPVNPSLCGVRKMRTGQPGDRVLDVGCGKRFLLYEFTQVVSGIVATGLDISQYAIQHAKPEVRSYLHIGTALSLPYADHTSDLVLTINTLHNLW